MLNGELHAAGESRSTEHVYPQVKNNSVDQVHLVQMSLRCKADLEERIIRAFGASMSHSGKGSSRNEFLCRLLEMGLQQVDLEQQSRQENE